MSFASSSRQAIFGRVRCFSTTAVASRSKGPPSMKVKSQTQSLADDTAEFTFQDYTTADWEIINDLQSMRDLVQKVHQHRPLLESQRQAFTPPTAPIRLTTLVDLDDPEGHPKVSHRTLIAPVASLPLDGPDAINRAKLIAGTRWTPGFPTSGLLFRDDETRAHADAVFFGAQGEGIGREGWVKISAVRFPTARMNRKFASDTLDKLVAAANDPNSPVPADLPPDTRHLRSRAHRRRDVLKNAYSRQAAAARPVIVGGVRGFPLEWLKEEDRKQFQGKQEWLTSESAGKIGWPAWQRGERSVDAPTPRPAIA